MNTHPFMWVRESSRKATFWISAAIAVLAMIVLQVLGTPLKTPSAPAAIVSFELAGSLASTGAILASWDSNARLYAGLNLGFDYLFIAAYVAAIGVGCVLVAENLGRRGPLLAAAGFVLAWAMLVAGALDCTENYALIRLLLGSQADVLAVVARYCAIPKFLIVLLGLLYVVLGAAISSVVRGERKHSAA